MLKLKLSPQSIEDLEQIYIYTTDIWGSKQADKYQDELYLQMQNLALKPFLGQKYPFRPGYLKSRINRHIIFYKIDDDECIVIRILHEKMNYIDHLGNMP